MSHPTIATIATHLGLSRATVTHVLNGRATEQRISAATQTRVLGAAQEMGYRANASARAVRAGRYGSVALIQSLRGQYLPPELLTGLMDAIATRDLHLVFSQVQDQIIQDQIIEEETYLPQTIRQLAVDGVLLNRHLALPPDYLARIQSLRIPAISLNVKQEFDAVHPDDTQGGVLATEFLLALGHENIAFVDSDEPSNKHYSKHDRRAGYEQVVASAGKRGRVYLLPKTWHYENSEDKRITAAMALLREENCPTAVLAYEISEAMAIVHAAHRLGLHIPQDLSIVLFHNRLDDRFFLPFHTISNQMEQVGREGVAMLLEKMNNPTIPLSTRAIMPVLLKGMTCQPPISKKSREQE